MDTCIVCDDKTENLVTTKLGPMPVCSECLIPAPKKD